MFLTDIAHTLRSYRFVSKRIAMALLVALGTSASLASAQILPGLATQGSSQVSSQTSSIGQAQPGQTQFGDWSKAEQSRWRWVAETQGVGDQERLLLGLEAELQPGWKIYWRSPGDAGLPPKLMPEPDSDLTALDFLWPVPHRFQTYGIDTFGYKEHVLFPVSATVARPGQEQRIHTKVSFLICEEICVPGQTKVGLDVPAGPAEASFEAPMIREALLQVPDQGQRHNMALDALRFDANFADGQEPQLWLQVASREPLNPELDAFVEAPQGWRFARPEVTLSADAKSATLRLAASPQFATSEPFGLEDLAVTIADGARAFEVPSATLTLIGQQEAPNFAARTKPASPNRGNIPAQDAGLVLLASMLLTALLGGLILNFMPCVLPVLSLKVLSVVKAQSVPLSHARRGFLATAAGIVFSFLVLALGAVALKWAGAAVGWGMQFQQPVFLLFMIALLMLFALNMFGLFELRMPAGLGGLAGVGTGDSLLGHFATGAFATLLATPCSAPFLGTALGFALTRGTGEILMIFATLGLGMASPYLLIAAFPKVARLLPKPGAWMVWLKVIMGFALVATAVWLLSVLLQQLGLMATLAATALIVLASGLFALRRLPSLARLPSLVPGLVLALILALPLAFERPSVVAASPTSAGYQVFDLAEVEASVVQGKTIFVDVTAQWCVTCKINKLRVLETSSAKALFAEQQVELRQADWTNHSDEIAAYLASFQRFGIPFNVVYGPAAPSGIVLPELLTFEAVERAIAQAS
jgi:suppressor for copper-sensitivity B